MGHWRQLTNISVFVRGCQEKLHEVFTSKLEQKYLKINFHGQDQLYRESRFAKKLWFF